MSAHARRCASGSWRSVRREGFNEKPEQARVSTGAGESELRGRGTEPFGKTLSCISGLQLYCKLTYLQASCPPPCEHKTCADLVSPTTSFLSMRERIPLLVPLVCLIGWGITGFGVGMWFAALGG